jgi:hypothetical protein
MVPKPLLRRAEWLAETRVRQDWCITSEERLSYLLSNTARTPKSAANPS